MNGFRFKSKNKEFFFEGFSNPADLQEGIQEVFCRAFSENARLSYDGLSSYEKYLKAIARNYVIDYMRWSKKRAALFKEKEPEPMIKEEGSINDISPLTISNPEKVIVISELKEILEDFLANISSDELELLKWHILNEYSQEETASKMGLNRYLVRKRLYKIRKRLLKILINKGHLKKGDKITELLPLGLLLG
jgi:RNA polymerase sigma factor (sigma-70 family)